jgi:hypothetical protein
MGHAFMSQRTTKFTDVRQSEPAIEINLCGGRPWNALFVGICPFESGMKISRSKRAKQAKLTTIYGFGI